MQQLRDVFKSMRSRSTVRGPLATFEIFEAWKAVTTRFSGVAMAPASFASGVLTIAVAHGTWAREFSLMRRDFIAKIDEQLGARVIRDIQFVVRNISHDAARGVPSSPPHASPLRGSASYALDFALPRETSESMAAQSRELLPREHPLRDMGNIPSEWVERLTQLWRQQMRRFQQLTVNRATRCTRCGAPAMKDNICDLCQISLQRAEYEQLIRSIRKNPDRTLDDIRRAFPGVTDTTIAKARERVRQVIGDELERIGRAIRADARSASLWSRWDELGKTYFCLVEGSDPQLSDASRIDRILERDFRFASFVLPKRRPGKTA